MVTWLARRKPPTPRIPGDVVGIGTRSVVIGVQATVVPLGVIFGVLMLLDLKWLLTLHPTPEDIEPLDPDQ